MRRRLAEQSAPEARVIEMKRRVSLCRLWAWRGNRRVWPVTKAAVRSVVFGGCWWCSSSGWCRYGAIDKQARLQPGCGLRGSAVGGMGSGRAIRMGLVEWAAKASSSLKSIRKHEWGLQRLHLPESDISTRRAGCDSLLPLKKPDPAGAFTPLQTFQCLFLRLLSCEISLLYHFSLLLSSTLLPTIDCISCTYQSFVTAKRTSAVLCFSPSAQFHLNPHKPWKSRCTHHRYGIRGALGLRILLNAVSSEDRYGIGILFFTSHRIFDIRSETHAIHPTSFMSVAIYMLLVHVDVPI
jgi:hypothetical protein